MHNSKKERGFVQLGFCRAWGIRLFLAILKPPADECFTISSLLNLYNGEVT